MIVGAEDDVLRHVSARLPGGCEVLGKVPHEQVPALLGNARVGLDVHPWLSPHLLPAFAVKVCEYMACGCAVVASAMPVLDGLLARSGLEPSSMIRIEGGEPEDYARAVGPAARFHRSGRRPRRGGARLCAQTHGLRRRGRENRQALSVAAGKGVLSRRFRTGTA